MSRAAVLLKKVIDPRAGPFEGTIRWRNIDLQQFDFVRRLRPLVGFHPDTLLLRNDFTLAVEGTAAGTVSELFGAGLRTNILQIRDNTIAALLAAEGWDFDRKFRPRKRVCQGGLRSSRS